MILTELFNDPYPVTWDEKWAPQEISARTQSRAGNLKIAFLRFYSSDVITVEFSLGDGFELTGRGDEIAIFGTVKRAIEEYLTKYGRPEFFVFTSKGDKRTRTYANLIKRYAPGMGYAITNPLNLPELAQDNLGDSIQHDDYFVLRDQRRKLDEIQSIGTSDVLVGFDRGAFTPQELGPTFTRLNKKIAYTITKRGDLISMYYAFEPNRYENFAFLATIPDSSSVIPKARRVEMAAVHPQFQRQGWGTKLYDIFFDKVGGYLLADYKQSPGAKKIWADMAKNPKLEVVGLLGIDSDNFNTDPNSYYGVSDKEHDALWKKLMDIGAQHVRQKGQREWFMVPVQNLGKRLEILQHFRVYNQVDFYSEGNEIEVELLAYPKDAKLKESGSIKIPDSNQARQWIRKVYELYPLTWQRNHVMTWGEGEDQELAMFELEPNPARPNHVEVKWFQAYPLRRGVGTRAMRELQRLAQEDGIGLTLYAWDKGQVSRSQLMKFYRSVGFRPTTGRSASMLWQPDQVDEGWREKVAGAAAAATLGYGAVSQMDQPQTPAPLAQPAQTRTAAARPDADAAIQAQVPQAHRDLVQQARAAGIRGRELAHFVAQMAHETGNWQHMEEQPPRGAKNPQRYFARKYEGKKILGNSHRGDGYRFRGRGYVQLTGRDNYSRAGRALGIDLVNDPDQAADPATAAQIAVWYWKNRVAPRVQDFTQASVPQVTRQINPGQRGAQQRQAQYQRLAQR